ncbi:MAG: hypothetical protein NVSMB32_00300 [Actinomycetota bacterium]
MESPIPRNAADQNFFGPNPMGDARGDLEDSYFKLPKKIVVVTWGALSWDPGDLPLVFEDPEHPESAWHTGGPEIPIEFSRVAVDCRLIPVIDPQHGVPVPTLYARSRRNDLDAAIQDLLKAEGATNPKRIGFVDVKENKHRCLTYQAMAEPITEWVRAHDVDCAIWAELPANFKNHTGRDFSVDTAIKYLGELPKLLVDQAKEYVNRAPASIETPLRKRLREGGWPE